MNPVARVDSSDIGAFVAQREPVIVTGLMRDWRAMRRWSLLYFQLKYGRRVVTVEHYPRGDFFEPWYESEMELREYLSLLQAPRGEERLYLAQRDVVSRLPKIDLDYEPPTIFPRERLRTAYLFLGVDSVTGCHYHTSGQALLCQVVGQKRVVLYDPKDFALLQPEPWYSPRYNWSKINFAAPSPKHSESLRRAKTYEAILSPGEALFIPLHWWHVVYGQQLSISLTFFWRPELADYYLPNPTLRDLPRETLLRARLALSKLTR